MRQAEVNQDHCFIFNQLLRELREAAISDEQCREAVMIDEEQRQHGECRRELNAQQKEAAVQTGEAVQVQITEAEEAAQVKEAEHAAAQEKMNNYLKRKMADPIVQLDTFEEQWLNAEGLTGKARADALAVCK